MEKGGKIKGVTIAPEKAVESSLTHQNHTESPSTSAKGKLPIGRLQDGFPFNGYAVEGGDTAKATARTSPLLNGTSSGQLRWKDVASQGEAAQEPRAALQNEEPSTPPPRPSVQFSRSILNSGQSNNAHWRSTSEDFADQDNAFKERRGGSLFTKLKSFASPGGPTSHTRSQSAYTVRGNSIDGRFTGMQLSPNAERGNPLRGPPAEHDSDIDADVEGSSGEDDLRGSSPRRKRRKSRRPQEADPQTMPSTPKTPRTSRSNFLSSSSVASGERFRPSFLPRRATMTDLPGEVRQGVSEDEGRARINRNSAWPRGSGWSPRGISYSGNRKQSQAASTEERRPSNLRRLTGIGAVGDAVEGSSFSPWKLTRADRAATISGAARWRHLKGTLKTIAQRRKAEHTVDHAKSAELLAELTAGAPAALMLASMFQRDQRGNKKIPVLLEQLKVRILETEQAVDSSGDRHFVFYVKLEYGNGLTRMQWRIQRSLNDFYKLHVRYKAQLGLQKYTQLRRDDPRKKLPHFPTSTFPILRGLRGLDNVSGSDHEEDREGEDTGRSGGEASGAERSGKRRKVRPILGTSRRKSSVANLSGGDASMRKEAYTERQRKSLEQYLQRLIRFLMFRPESNRLCKFLELSALGVRLAAEGSYHGKEGLLMIQSGKGVDFRKAWTPSLLKSRHGPKWFIVRHSYIVCVDSPEAMNIYDVFLVDSSFEIQTKGKGLLKHKQKPKDAAKAAKESASHPKHHRLKLSNSERKLRLLAKNERQLKQFDESIREMIMNSLWSKPKRFESFAPVRTDVFAQWLVDGRDYMWNVSRAISMAKDVIYIHDWWLSPELYMRRPAAISQKWRLDRLLQQKAREGVKVFVIVYRNINSAIPIDSEYTKFSLLDLHPNVFVQRSPNQFRQNTFFWAHHEKICIIDHMVAFVGGIDLCFGRWDTPQHTVVDDKLTGFELSDTPKDADHCQLWPGKDYSNPRVLDFYALDKPYEEMYDRAKVPRMPWHDIHMQIVGQPARDLTRHFVQRWNFILRQRKPTRPTPFLLPPPDFNPTDLEALGLNGTCEVQILRSACWWSLGTPDQTEHSILNAYIKLIEQSEHYVYIENQFFISSCEVEGRRVENQIGDALVERMIRASKNREDWRAFILIPLMPGFQNTVDQQDGTSVRLIMQCQYRSICRGEASIFGRVRAEGIEPEDYIQFYSLRSWGKIGPTKQLVTEQLYIHAKCMIVDDRVAIIGSANINERSMLGSRDSECAAVVRDTDMLWSTMNGEPYLVGKFAHTLRMRLMREHLGVDVDETMEDEQEEKDEQENLESSRGRERSNYGANEGTVPRDDSQEEVVQRVERMSSFNHDVDWEQSDNPNLRSNKKLTGDPRVTNNIDHKKDVDGEGADAMKQEALAGRAGRRDTQLATIGKSSREILKVMENSETAKSRLSGSHQGEIRQRSVSRVSRMTDDGGNLGLPPQTLTPTSTSTFSFSQSSTLPALPLTDDTDIGGPPLQRSSSKTTAEFSHPLVAEMKRPFVEKDCMRDPLNDSFFLDTWHTVAENNTKLFRHVFRCMPDNEVKDWKEYKEYAAYAERFSQAQGGGKSKDRVQQDAPGASGPPGQSSLADKLRMLGPIGEAAGNAESKTETLNEKLMHGLGQKENGLDQKSMGKIEEWAEEANRAQAERQQREMDERAMLSPLSDTAMEEKIPVRSSNDIKHSATFESESLTKLTSPSSASGQPDGLHKNASLQKRRRRTTTRSSRREFRASDDIMSQADADDLMRLVQGHLVLWPYDWLAKEEQGGNWLYSIDGLAPLEIYN